MKLGYLLAAMAIGGAFALQPIINGAAGRILGGPVPAAAISVAITLIGCFLLLPFFGGAPRAEAVAALPWWVVFGGLIGVAVVAGSAAIAPVTGAAAFFVCLIAGQLIGSTLIDHFGLFGLAERHISPVKLGGLALVFAGVMLVRME